MSPGPHGTLPRLTPYRIVHNRDIRSYVDPGISEITTLKMNLNYVAARRRKSVTAGDLVEEGGTEEEGLVVTGMVPF